MYSSDEFETASKRIADRIKMLSEFPFFLARAEAIGKLYRSAPAYAHHDMLWEGALIVKSLINVYGRDECYYGYDRNGGDVYHPDETLIVN